MAKDLISSVRFDIEHLAHIEDALARLNQYPETFSKLIRYATIGFLNASDPNWVHRPPSVRAIDRVTSMTKKNRRKGSSNDELIAISESLKGQQVAPIAGISTGMNIPQTSVEDIVSSPVDKLRKLANYRGQLISQMPEELKLHGESVWQALTSTNGHVTIAQQLAEDSNPKVRAITALLVDGLLPHDPSIVTEEELKMVKQVFSEEME